MGTSCEESITLFDFACPIFGIYVLCKGGYGMKMSANFILRIQQSSVRVKEKEDFAPLQLLKFAETRSLICRCLIANSSDFCQQIAWYLWRSESPLNRPFYLYFNFACMHHRNLRLEIKGPFMALWPRYFSS